MSEARRNLDWEKQFELAIDPEKHAVTVQKANRKRRYMYDVRKMCAVRNINKILRGEDVDIMD